MSDYSKPMFEVRVAKNGEALTEYYRAAFRKRFFTDPILEIEDTEVMRWLARHVGDDIERGKLIVDVYFSLSDKEFTDNAYPPFWLKKKINRVLSAVGQRCAATGSSRTLMVRSWVYCANIKCKAFEIECKASELDQAHFCRACATERGTATMEVNSGL